MKAAPLAYLVVYELSQRAGIAHYFSMEINYGWNNRDHICCEYTDNLHVIPKLDVQFSSLHFWRAAPKNVS